MTGVAGLVLASAAFVGTHFLMSHPLRAPMVKALGERGFGLVYIVVSFVTLYGMTRYYGPASAEAPSPKTMRVGTLKVDTLGDMVSTVLSRSRSKFKSESMLVPG